MNTSTRSVFLLFIALGCAPTVLLPAQSFTTLYSFTGGTNGRGPMAELILSSNTLYGTSTGSPATPLLDIGNGPFYGSTLFRVNLDGSGFSNLYTLTPTDGSWPFANSDGALRALNGALLLSGRTLYGTAALGGLFGFGTVFRVNLDGSGFTNLHNFPEPINSNGSVPSGGLALSGETLYGTAAFYGSGGTIFKVNTDGTGFATLYQFKNGSDGAAPQGGLILAGNTLYGTSEGEQPGVGGTISYGSVFKVNTDGTVFAVLHAFTSTSVSSPDFGSNRDGANPLGKLLLSGNTLYGTTLGGGLWGSGVVFRVNTDGTGFTNLHNFAAAGIVPTNSDGFPSSSGLALVGNKLYGTALYGGSAGQGTVFQLNTDGSGFQVLHHFAGGNDGGYPGNGLVVVSNKLYGVTWGGGASGNGTVFSLALTPASAPLITSQPSSRTNIAGTTASFGVVASGTAPLSYQWLKGTNALSQQNGSTLSLTNVSDADASTYSVIVSNAAGTVTSEPATLTVIDPPVIAKQPLSQTNVIGSTASFSVVATGTGPLNYQWFKGATALPQQKGSNLTLIKLSYADAGTYHAVVTNIVGSITSTPATLTVINLPRLTVGSTLTNFILTWPSDASGFTVQSTTNLGPHAVWTTNNSPEPFMVNGQNTVTSRISGPQRFFRLRQ